jgi:hypothetical protein
MSLYIQDKYLYMFNNTDEYLNTAQKWNWDCHWTKHWELGRNEHLILCFVATLFENLQIRFYHDGSLTLSVTHYKPLSDFRHYTPGKLTSRGQPNLPPGYGMDSLGGWIMWTVTIYTITLCCPCYMTKYVPRLEGIMHSVRAYAFYPWDIFRHITWTTQYYCYYYSECLWWFIKMKFV